MSRIPCFTRAFLSRSAPSVPGIITLIAAIGLAMAGTAFATSWETSSMRTPGGGLIRIGMTRQEVLKELGPPLRQRGSTQKTASSGKSGRKSSSFTYQGDDGLYTISFSGEQVVKIMVTPKRD